MEIGRISERPDWSSVLIRMTARKASESSLQQAMCVPHLGCRIGWEKLNCSMPWSSWLEVVEAGYAAVVEVERLGGICHPIWLVSFSSGSQPLTVTGGLVAGIGRTPLSG